VTTPDHDPYTALLDELAALREHLTRLDTRETDHHATLTAQLTALTTGPGQADDDASGYQPGPTPAWWTLAGEDRREPVAQLRGWVDRVYRPGYGHLAAALGPCWASHDLCLYALDIAAALWSVLYLQPGRTPGLVSAQAEYQARILPALAAQLHAETTRCGHPRSTR
jgi:hypothetical protein